MQNAAASRYRFIAHALNADGPFRPVVVGFAGGQGAALSGRTYLIQYPRESAEKFARRNELAFYASPLAHAAQRFVGYLSEKPPLRELTHELYKRIADDADGKGNALDVLWSGFCVEAKARGAMLLLVDMPRQLPANAAAQMEQRAVPFLTPIAPETVTEYELGADGKFNSVKFSGSIERPSKDGRTERVACTWRFTRTDWAAFDAHDKLIDGDAHSLGECPVLIFSETGDFPCFGSFAAIADLSKRLFNLDSELDEILRSQTFSLAVMQVPESSTEAQKIEAAKTIGVTVGTQNLMLYTGTQPAFIAPPDGPASVYMQRIADLRKRIDDIGLAVASPEQRESGISMQMRFRAINAAVSKFSERMEDFERRVWELCRRWLGLSVAPTASWSRNFQLADIQSELQVLSDMQAAAMPKPVIVEQQRRIVSLQFAGSERTDDLFAAIDEQLQERPPPRRVA